MPASIWSSQLIVSSKLDRYPLTSKCSENFFRKSRIWSSLVRPTGNYGCDTKWNKKQFHSRSPRNRNFNLTSTEPMKVVLQRKSIDLVIVKLQDLLYQYSRPKIPKVQGDELKPSQFDEFHLVTNLNCWQPRERTPNWNSWSFLLSFPNWTCCS